MEHKWIFLIRDKFKKNHIWYCPNCLLHISSDEDGIEPGVADLSKFMSLNQPNYLSMTCEEIVLAKVHDE